MQSLVEKYPDGYEGFVKTRQDPHEDADEEYTIGNIKDELDAAI